MYALLPAFLRVADAAQGWPLRALLAVLEDEYREIHQNVGQLYEDWFIETCQDWVVPYLGALLGLRGLDEPELGWYTHRALVGNTVGYRRRKGTPAVLAAAVRDATGWPGLAVTSWELLAMTQSLTRVRPGRGGTVDLRDAGTLARLGGAFDTLPHGVDVRWPNVTQLPRGEEAQLEYGTGGGARFNLGRIALFLWRLGSYPRILGDAREVAPGCYTFHPFGLDGPLFNPPRSGSADLQLGLPFPLRRAPLAAAVEAFWLDRQPLDGLLAAEQPVVEVRVRHQGSLGAPLPIKPRSLLFCDLSGWQRPPAVVVYRRADGSRAEQPVQVAIDPERGRLAFPAGVEVDEVEVVYAYGASADLGGGPYSRPEAGRRESAATWVGYVYAAAPPAAGATTTTLAVTARSPALVPITPAPCFSTLAEALADWLEAGGDGILRVADSGTYALPAEISLAPAAGSGPGRRLTIAAIDGVCPCLTGDLRVAGAAAAAATATAGTGEEATTVAPGAAGALALDGLWIDGAITLSGALGEVSIVDCTLQPPRPGEAPRPGETPRPSLAWEGPAPSGLAVRLERSITGPLRLPAASLGLWIEGSIVDGGTGVALAGEEGGSAGGSAAADGVLGPPSTFARVTFFGPVRVAQLLSATDVLFTAPVTVSRPDEGEVRFCYVPPGSVTPYRHRCQPAPGAPGRDQPALAPAFTSTAYGQPGYAQLAPDGPREIATGGSDGSEIGVYAALRQPQRLANLPMALAEYLRWGLEAVVTFAT